MFYLDVYDQTVSLELISESRFNLLTDGFKLTMSFVDPDEIEWTVWILTEELVYCKLKTVGLSQVNCYESQDAWQIRKAYAEHKLLIS